MKISTSKQIKALKALSSITPPDSKTPDNILTKILEDTASETPGRTEELFRQYQASEDKRGFKRLFRTLTGVSFKNYLRTCIEAAIRNITKPGDQKRTNWIIKLVFRDSDENKSRPSEMLMLTSETPVYKHEIFTTIDNTTRAMRLNNMPLTAENITTRIKNNSNIKIQQLDRILKDVIDEDFTLTCQTEAETNAL